jgi:phenylpyruvate tautomerase PptA (4-oxalocrotonate tautomerase family)
MPMIRLTVPPGSLTDEGRKTVQRDLASVLLRWEGAPDTAFFRAQAWSYLVELPEGAQTTAEDEEPRFLVDVTVPQGALSERRKAGLVEDATKTVLGAGGSVIRYADLVALAKGQRTDA